MEQKIISVKNKNFNFSTEDVLNEQNIEKLKNWRYQIELHLSELQAKVETGKVHLKAGKVTKKWLENLQGYMSLQHVLRRQLIARIKLLQKPANLALTSAKIESGFWRRKIKHVVSERVFEMLEQELKNLLKKQKEN